MSMYEFNSYKEKQNEVDEVDEVGVDGIASSGINLEDVANLGYVGLPKENTIEAQKETEVSKQEIKAAPFDPSVYLGEGKKVAGEIYQPLISAAESEKEAIDFAAKMEVEGIEKTIPYVTRQFEAYQAKSGIGTGMQARQSNQLVMDIAATVGNVYQQAELSKYAVNSKVAEYQSAMASGAYDIATEKYNEALSQAQFMSDYLDMPFVQPEVQFMYDQMTVAQKIIADPDATPDEISQAQSSLSDFEKTLKDLGYTGDIGEGLQTYQQKLNELETFYQEAYDLYESSSFEVQYASQLQTVQAWKEVQQGNVDIADIFEKYPGADISYILDLLEQGQDVTGLEALNINVTPTE